MHVRSRPIDSPANRGNPSLPSSHIALTIRPRFNACLMFPLPLLNIFPSTSHPSPSSVAIKIIALAPPHVIGLVGVIRFNISSLYLTF